MPQEGGNGQARGGVRKKWMVTGRNRTVVVRVAQLQPLDAGQIVSLLEGQCYDGAWAGRSGRCRKRKTPTTSTMMTATFNPTSIRY